jgi:hypothetical protein
MPLDEPDQVDVKASSLIASYIDSLSIIPLEVSSRQVYEEIKRKQGNSVSVSHFNRVRFLAKFRQMEIDEEADYLTCFAEMKRFNNLSEQLFRLRVR